MIGLETLLQPVFEAGAVKLVELAVEHGFNNLSISSSNDSSKIDFESHLKLTFEKCSNTKTLINPDNPVPLMDLYIQSQFSTSKKTAEEKIIDDFAMIEEIWDRKRVVISGSAGTGKSFFTKYLWLAAFQRSNGKIPIYIELRNLNDLTTVSLASYLFRTVISNNYHPEAYSKFESALQEGRFFFIFDGFDEVKKDKRSDIEKEILALSDISPDNVIVVTGRPDEVFQSWQAFWSFHVEKLNKQQVVKLIEKVSFDEIVKKRFTQRVKKDLYDKHESLLSTPLLATIMLLTFNSFADIPDKVHVFYEQAFETLFARHDALKGSFKRTLLTGLPIDIFKNQFASFCLITYDKEVYSFSEAKILEYLEQSKKMTGLTFNSGDFLRDLMEVVCMLQRDGLNIIFSHRSFQEFFAARCLSRLEIEKVTKLLPKYLSRFNDTSGGMLYDMDRDLVERCYLIPTYREFLPQLIEQSELSGIQKTCADLGCSARLLIYSDVKGKKNETVKEMSLRFNDDQFDQFNSIVHKLLRAELFSTKDSIEKLYELDKKALAVGLKKQWIKITQQEKVLESSVVFDVDWKIDVDQSLKLEKWYKMGGYIVYRKIRAIKTVQLCEDMIKQHHARSQSIDTLLGL